MTWADTYYVNFLNQTRFTKKLLPDPNGLRVLPSNTPTKWAVLSVLATRYPLSVSDIGELLKELSYRRGRKTLLKALKRCTVFGLASPFGPKWQRKWVLTNRGKDLLCAPKKAMKSKIKDLMKKELEAATQWMSVADLYDATTYNPNTIARILRADKTLFKFEVVPGSKKLVKQWALATKDTTNWTNATPRKTPKVLFKRTSQLTAATARIKATAAAAVVTINPRYQGIPMCLSATVAAKASLIEAVGDVVTKEFIPAQKKFSAYDVTKRMRELVSQPTTTVSPAETGTVNVKGKAVPKILHEDVREIVHELFNQGLMTGYDRAHVGQYFEYDLVANIAAAQTPAAQPVTTTSVPTPAGQDGGSYDGSSTI